MSGNIFLRTSVVLLTIGMAFGVFMGATHDFTFAPAHAHLNLVGGVIMFLAGLFYNSRPSLSPKLIMTHYVIALLGVLLLVPGIYGSLASLPWAPVVVGAGSVLTLLNGLFFAFMVFKGTGKAA